MNKTQKNGKSPSLNPDDVPHYTLDEAERCATGSGLPETIWATTDPDMPFFIAAAAWGEPTLTGYVVLAPLVTIMPQNWHENW